MRYLVAVLAVALLGSSQARAQSIPPAVDVQVRLLPEPRALRALPQASTLRLVLLPPAPSIDQVLAGA